MNRPSSGRHATVEPAPSIVVSEGGDAAVVQVRVAIDVSVADQLRAEIAGAADRCGHVVLDLSDVPTVDPTGLGMLVRARQRARQNDCLVCLVAPSRFVVTVLHTMRVDRIFPVFDDCPSALGWLQRLPTAGEAQHQASAESVTA